MAANSNATRLLARTALGDAASQQAEQFAHERDEHTTFSAWLLEGIVWQQCQECRRTCYPARPLCPYCLSEQLLWQPATGAGKLLAATTLKVSFNALYQSNVPWPVGLIAHEQGPSLYAFLDRADLVVTGRSMTLFTVPDPVGKAVVIAVSSGPDARERGIAIAARLPPAA